MTGEDVNGRETPGVGLSATCINGIMQAPYVIVTDSGVRLQGGDVSLYVTNSSARIDTGSKVIDLLSTTATFG